MVLYLSPALAVPVYLPWHILLCAAHGRYGCSCSKAPDPGCVHKSMNTERVQQMDSCSRDACALPGCSGHMLARRNAGRIPESASGADEMHQRPAEALCSSGS